MIYRKHSLRNLKCAYQAFEIWAKYPMDIFYPLRIVQNTKLFPNLKGFQDCQRKFDNLFK